MDCLEIKLRDVIKENNKKIGEVRARMGEVQFELESLRLQYSQLIKINNGIRGQIAINEHF